MATCHVHYFVEIKWNKMTGNPMMYNIAELMITQKERRVSSHNNCFSTL